MPKLTLSQRGRKGGLVRAPKLSNLDLLKDIERIIKRLNNLREHNESLYRL